MVLATWWGWSNGPSIALAVVLAFFFGYLLTSTVGAPRRPGTLRTAVTVALAADTVSILVMEIVDNLVLCSCRVRWTPAWATCCSGARWRSRWPSPSWSPSR